jgi:hypothetical protein
MEECGARASPVSAAGARALRRRQRDAVLCAAGEHAAHVRERDLHPRKRILRVDLVLEVHVAGILDLLERAEDAGDRQLSLPDGDLAVALRHVGEILDVHVVKPRSGVEHRLHDVGARADGVSAIDAQPHPRIHPLHVLQHVVRRGEVLVLGAVVVDRDLDVVLLRELLDAGQHARVAGADDRRHPRGLGVGEVLLHAGIGILIEGDRATADDREPLVLDVLANLCELGGGLVVRHVHGLEVHVRRTERLDHLERPVERELAKRVAGDAELDLVRRCGGR